MNGIENSTPVSGRDDWAGVARGNVTEDSTLTGGKGKTLESEAGGGTVQACNLFISNLVSSDLRQVDLVLEDCSDGRTG